MASDQPDGFQRRGQAWFCTSGLPADIIIDVQEMSFHLHKFPLMSRSGRLARIISEVSENEESSLSSSSAMGIRRITVRDIPGGADAFEVAAKFCYGVKVEFRCNNVAALRCAADYLEMSEELGEGNLILKTEDYLNKVVLRSWNDSILALESCKTLFPLAHELNIVKRCLDSIAMKACTDPGLFGWPMEGSSAQSQSQSVVADGPRVRSGPDWWYDDICVLSLPFFCEAVQAMHGKGVRNDTIGGAVMHYARKFIPGLSRRQGQGVASATLSSSSSSSSSASCADQKHLLETVEYLLPYHKSAVTTSFLFGMLRTANILNASDECKASLEKRLGSQLEFATLDDLLMPSYCYTIETLYDVDCVARILGHFINSNSLDLHSNPNNNNGCNVVNTNAPAASADMANTSVPPPPSAMTPFVTVAKLLDAYLAEVAPDANLKSEKFLSLALALPHAARNFHDGLYRAIDIYIKAHPGISEEERERLCGAMDCQKLSMEACTHAAQNERLPLRVLVHVLFLEQMQLRNAIAGAFMNTAPENRDTDADHFLEVPRPSNFNSVLGLPQFEGQQIEEEEELRDAEALRHNRLLKMDMVTMRNRVRELERVCSSLRHAINKMEKPKQQQASPSNSSSSSSSSWFWGRGFMPKKFSCKFRMQVCDSHSQESVLPPHPPPPDATIPATVNANKPTSRKSRNHKSKPKSVKT